MSTRRKRKLILKYTLIGMLIMAVVSFILYGKDNFSTLAVDSSIEDKYVYPVGLPSGIYLKTNGVMVIDNVEFENDKGETVNPSKGKIEPGDYVTKFNDISVGNKSQLQYLIEKNGDKEIEMTILSKNRTKVEKLCPEKNKDGQYNLGIWIRDDMQSIGTISFITEENHFFSLGHGICDVDTGKLLSSNEGLLYQANIWGVKKGEAGNPGGLCGSIDYQDTNKIGQITHNTNNGIWGMIDSEQVIDMKQERFEIGHSEEVKSGKAKIKFIYGGKDKYYEIEIIQIEYASSEKNMVIKITDPELIKETGGIVQGMSGCPIIQDEKVVGILTHVMVNNPQYGYGILVDKIYEEL